MLVAGTVAGVLVSGCGSSAPSSRWAGGSQSPDASLPAASPSTSAVPSASPGATAGALPRAGNPNGHAAVPADGQAVDTSHPNRIIGNGTPASCTSEELVSAIGVGGIITFNCGPAPLTITLKQTAKVRNASARVVLDGGGKITLSGGGQRRILYQNTCDAAQGWATSHCQDQETPQLTVQNITFADGNSTGEKTEGGGGGAIFDRGGRLKVVNARFVRNRCDQTGPDLGGAAVRALSQSHNLPVYIVNSTFGGASGQGGVCSNGGALSSIGVSWAVYNSVMSYNSAVGRGANPAKGGTPGGGSGGAIYLDGDLFTVKLVSTVIENNHANEGGGAVFFVSNDRTGTMSIEGSTLRHNKSDGFETDGLPGIFFLGARKPTVTGSTLQ
ncbi:MAG: hypothetical protein AUI10_02290 [Actinobacteria bacterium 13_2_20CM_2_72_6]|nr:MAG: hypothetical protein AUI10_02290 [Actinobacteria bacterium 13_2_20CM_2_72_6]